MRRLISSCSRCTTAANPSYSYYSPDRRGHPPPPHQARGNHPSAISGRPGPVCTRTRKGKGALGDRDATGPTWQSSSVSRCALPWHGSGCWISSSSTPQMPKRLPTAIALLLPASRAACCAILPAPNNWKLPCKKNVHDHEREREALSTHELSHQMGGILT